MGQALANGEHLESAQTQTSNVGATASPCLAGWLVYLWISARLFLSKLPVVITDILALLFQFQVVTDDTFVEGKIGVIAANKDNPTEVLFSNAMVWTGV
jgi:hypothetical protein